MARSVDQINRMMVGVYSPSICDERGIFTCSIPTSNEWDIQVQRLPNSKPNGTKGCYKHLVPHWPWDGSLCSINRENWEQRVCPLGTWSFRARKGGNYARTYVRARAPPLAGGGGGRPAPVPVPGRVGLGLGLRSGSGSTGLGFRSESEFPTWPDSFWIRFQGPALVANLLDCQRLRTCWIAKGCAPVGQPKVAKQSAPRQRLRLLGCQQTRLLDQRLQPLVRIQTCWPSPGKLYIALHILNWNIQNTNRELTLYLSLYLKFWTVLPTFWTALPAWSGIRDFQRKVGIRSDFLKEILPSSSTFLHP